MKKIALLLLMFVAFQVSAQDFHFLRRSDASCRSTSVGDSEISVCRYKIRQASILKRIGFEEHSNAYPFLCCPTL